MMQLDRTADEYKRLYNRISAFVDELPLEEKTDLLYSELLDEADESLSVGLCGIIGRLQLLNFDYIAKLLQHLDFQKQKRALLIAAYYDKPYYNAEDICLFESLKDDIASRFKETGTRTSKKQMLSSKEKEVWICECGKTNDISGFSYPYCDSCSRDIYGFRKNEVSPQSAIKSIETKIELISELIS